MNLPQMSTNLAVVGPNDMDTTELETAPVSLTVRSFGLTDIGKLRESNQDQFLIAVLRKALEVQGTSLPQSKHQRGVDRGQVFVVADGMGGQAGGKEASALAIDSVETFLLETFKWFFKFKGKEEDKLLAEFHNALVQANSRVLAEAKQHPELRGMGTTLTLAYSLNDELFVAHVGDSRCYLCRHDHLYRLTRDHTLVQEMVQRGGLSAEAIEKHRLRHVITNVVGGDSAEVQVEVHKLELEAGDAVLLATDGLTNMLADEEIARILHKEDDPERACRQLVARANAAGGKDNITVILVRYEAPE
jgi:PPM family protein phosphatase